MFRKETPSLLHLAKLHPRVEYVDETRRVFYVFFGDLRKEMEFCAKYGNSKHIFEAIGEYPEAAMEFLRSIESFESRDRRRFERAIFVAVETGGERALFFLRSPARFSGQMRPESYASLLLRVVSLSSECARFFLEDLGPFRGLPGFEEAKEAAYQRLEKPKTLVGKLLERLSSKKVIFML